MLSLNGADFAQVAAVLMSFHSPVTGADGRSLSSPTGCGIFQGGRSAGQALQVRDVNDNGRAASLSTAALPHLAVSGDAESYGPWSVDMSLLLATPSSVKNPCLRAPSIRNRLQNDCRRPLKHELWFVVILNYVEVVPQFFDKNTWQA